MMTEAAFINTPVSGETLSLVDQLAIARGLTREAFAAEAVQRVCESQVDLLAFIQVGTDAADRGDVVPHEQVMAELDAMIEKHRARCVS